MSPKSRRRPRATPRRKPGNRSRSHAGLEQTGRYTPPNTRLRFRPGWHKGIGAAAIVAGAVLFVVCEFNVGGIHHYGGHLWYIVGIALAGSSVWWFGAFDTA
jgi:hypothetical protein